MSETKDTTDKTLRSGQRKPLSLNRTVESGLVQQKFSHGRSKSVVVEVKRKRTLTGAEAEEVQAPAAPQPVAPKVAQQRPAPGRAGASGAAQSGAAAGQPQRILSEAERALRDSVMKQQREREQQEKAAKVEHDRQLEAERQHRIDQGLPPVEIAAADEAATASEAAGTQPDVEAAEPAEIAAAAIEPAIVVEHADPQQPRALASRRRLSWRSRLRRRLSGRQHLWRPRRQSLRCRHPTRSPSPPTRGRCHGRARH